MLPKISELFDLTQTDQAEIFSGLEKIWEAIPNIADYLAYYLENHQVADLSKLNQAEYMGQQVIIGEGTVIEPGVVIKGPALIGKNCQIRKGAYLRENVIIGHNSVVGNCTELKNVLLFNNVQAAHFNYIGDSILGYKVHLGTGAKITNAKTPQSEIKIVTHYHTHQTGLHKFGALIGDFTEIGANTVTAPGSIIGRNCLLYPLIFWRGVLPANSLVKIHQQQEITVKKGHGI
ncbi:MAG: hypothetical protein A2233_00145 [Candidatus Kerfeldbacteria bacterium RIFOXYA2_FULL_38_24]|uniref:Mannose-1-phosphate guanyltransferase C-terminal domain-containing protein n=1 Tax=Candidatus Kerfeldbacteria bacterium RIFOXYB2_FULL_38_14 TaxID=1798547 RepID=A0A1G2BAG0_9BACT|nr:MAG: hypothetical protein A2233_00145 [Candidatus Kerfeldbacteria bacterium RIFOXYA2_FULL_38_24]OGY86005.1 MAG: hypothetical protein A2319_00350 [Candidatus Kerfeldbacteria bacterium RIFOXYB2_FULL_38_14]